MFKNNVFGNKMSRLALQFVILTTGVPQKNIKNLHATYMAIITENSIICYNSSQTYVIECEKCRFLIPDPEIQV